MRLALIFLLAVGYAFGQAQPTAKMLLLGDADAPNTSVDSPGMGTYSSTQSVTITDATAQFILYTLTGTAPSCPATGTLYSGAFNISTTSTLKAIGCNGITGGAVLTSVYTISAGFNVFISSDYGTCTAGSAPTATCLQNATYPSLPSGASWTVTNTNSDVTIANSGCYQWTTFTLTGGSWPNSSSNCLVVNLGNTANYTTFTYPTSTVQNIVSNALPISTNWPQTTSSTGRLDIYSILAGSGSSFITYQLIGTGSTLIMNTECGDTPTGGNCVSGESTNAPNFPTSSTMVIQHYQKFGAGGSAYQGMWNTPQSGGALVAGSLASSTGTSTSGTTNGSSLIGNGNGGGGGGPTGYALTFGPEISCGLISSQSACHFPIAPGTQLISPVDSPGSGNYTSGQTVTVSNPPMTDPIYYTTCTSVGCTPTTPTTSSTLYTGSFTATPPEAVSYIAVLSGYVNSAVSTSDYVSPNATYVSSARAQTSSATTIAVTVSIPSGDIIVCANLNSATANTTGCTDSNSDTFNCSPEYDDTYGIEGCVSKAGAAVTTVTCHQTFSSQTINCLIAWYTPGTLSGVFDQSAGQGQTGPPWTTGNTATLATSADLVVGIWETCCSVTSTPTDGSIQRIITTGTYNGGLADRTAWGTAGTFASGNWGGTDSGPVAVIAIK